MAANGKSVKVLVADLMERMGEIGILDGEAVKQVTALQKSLSKHESYELETVRGDSGKVKKLDQKAIDEIIKRYNLGVSNNASARIAGVVGMMIGNIIRGNLYKAEVADAAARGIVIGKRETVKE